MQNEIRPGLFQEPLNGLLPSEIKLTASGNDNLPAACGLEPANDFGAEKACPPSYNNRFIFKEATHDSGV